MAKIYGSSVSTSNTAELYNNIERVSDKKANILVANKKKDLDIEWLSFASQTYDISNSLEDYLVVSLPIVTAGVPNRNMHCFPYEELTRFDPHMGNVVYKTLIGSATHQDHKNEQPSEAKGVIFDSELIFNNKYNMWNVWILAGFDRTKDPDLTEKIRKGKRSTYSMGSFVDYFCCSVCGEYGNSPTGEGHDHTYNSPGLGNLTDKNLVTYLNCVGVNFFETSSVDDPADINAEGKEIYIL